MSVSARNIIMTGSAVLALAGGAWAGGGMGSSKPSVPGHGPLVPGAGMGKPMGGPDCCKNRPKGHSVIVPGVNVAGPNINVGTPSVTVNQGNIAIGGTRFVNTNIVTQGVSGGGQTFVSTGGSYFAPSGVAPSALSNLNVSGGEERYTETITEQVPVTEETCAPQLEQQIAVRPVQAVCIDDKGVPHPASRVSSDESVGVGYQGEVFRCVAGSSMQVTVGALENGAASFAQAETFSCAKGEALVYRPGGELSCAPQTPQRNCNERSLLRRNGPGIKLIQMRTTRNACVPTTRTVMQNVTREVERVRPVETSGPMIFDGGVGQGVF